MPSYLLIETRDPFDSSRFMQHCELAAALVRDGGKVTLFLLENGVLGARSAARLPQLEKLNRLGVPVFADEFALRERGISVAEIVDQVKAVPLSTLVDKLAMGAKALWN
jgi:predicted peroxiredoxin